MHHHLEIVIPPVENIEEAIGQIMKPFDENPEPKEGSDEDDASSTRYSFWDWYVIGGRWSGSKLECTLNPDRKQAFFAELTKRKITVSGVQFGKQELSPATQIPSVDALWNELFPDAAVKVCPFFSHFNDQYQHSHGFPDVMPLKDMPSCLTASHVIVAGPSWENDAVLEARHMVQDKTYNGISFVESAWDGLVLSAIDQHRSRLAHCKPEYAAKHMPQDDWLVVTVDYHS